MNVLEGRPKRLGEASGGGYSDMVLWTNCSIVAAVARDGPDVVVDLTFVRPWTGNSAREYNSWRHNLVYDATVRFINAPRIVSVFVLNPSVECRLEPKWQVDGVIRFNGIKALVPTDFQENSQGHESNPVRHTIYCDDVLMTTRLSIRQTLKYHFFPRSHPVVVGEPPSSPPIEGQEWWPPTPAPSREQVY